MKKDFLLSLMAMAFCTGMQAQTRTMTLQTTDVEDIVVEGPSYEIPIVNYGKNIVTISADTLIHNAEVVVRDIKGCVIHRENTTISPAEKEIKIPQKQQKAKATMEIYYDEKSLYGSFEK